MALNTFQKARVRYHFDVAFSGSPFSGVTQGLRTLTRAGNLEYYMANLSPEDEAILLGQPYASISLYAPLTLGQTFSATINGLTASGAPEPAAWALMMTGLVGVGGALRRRRPLLA